MAASNSQAAQARAADILLVIHDFMARSPDELTLTRGDRIELIERDDDFGDGWFLGKHLGNSTTGLFPEVYTTTAPRGILSAQNHRRPSPSRSSSATNGTSATSKNNAQPATPRTPAHETPKTPNEAKSAVSVRASDSALASQMQSPESHSASTQRASLPSHTTKSTPSTLPLADSMTSPVMNETLSVIEEHITHMNTPRHSKSSRNQASVSTRSSDYGVRDGHTSSHINGEETDEEENERLTEDEVKSWSAARVAEHLEDAGVERKHCDVFREQEITGEVLLDMDQSSIFLKEFDLGPVGRRLKTWHKIRQLQMDVGDLKIPAGNRSTSDYSVAATSADIGRDRSMSAVAAPRIPSINEPNGGQTRGRTRTMESKSPQPLFQNESEASVGSSTRPSAASVRGLNHSRRHSSIDHAEPTPVPDTFPPIHSASPTGATSMSHQKQSSFDRTWTMGGHKPTVSTVSTGSASGRPLSTIHGHSVSSGHSAFNTDNVTVVSSIDLDRGYFSGNEVENRKSRNVLRKGQSPNHSRVSSFSSAFKRRSGSATHIRGASNDSMHDSVGPMRSPTSNSYSNKYNKGPKRAASGPEPIRATLSHDFPPTVTKLEYNNAGSIDAIASSPHLIESETSSINQSPNAPTSGRSFPKVRAMGLRAISDAITSSEKGLVSSPTDMQKDSPMQSPTRTGSSTPSGTSKSFDMEDQQEKGLKSSTSSGGTHLGPMPSVAVRRKTKKATSAYIRGLEKKSPKEQIEGCDYSGWMKKKSSNVMATWKSRLFVLRGRRLSYYYSENDTEEKGLIDISSHRVLPANDEKLAGLHATLTGAARSPTSPQGTVTQTTAALIAAGLTERAPNSPASGIFIFKLVPPRDGLSKAVNFTKPTVHYFAVDNIQQGRLWMAALMKATIDRDDGMKVITTYNQKTISLAKARAMMTRPPALMGDDSPAPSVNGASREGSMREKGLGLTGVGEEREAEEREERRNNTLGGGTKPSLDDLNTATVI